MKVLLIAIESMRVVSEEGHLSLVATEVHLHSLLHSDWYFTDDDDTYEDDADADEDAYQSIVKMSPKFQITHLLHYWLLKCKLSNLL